MSDLFHEQVDSGCIDEIFAVMATAAQHSFLVLTKRAKRMMKWFHETISGAQRESLVYERYRRIGLSSPAAGKQRTWPGWPLPNVWLGVSAEDQPTFDERVSLLLQVPAAKRFVSLEPLLEQIVINPCYLGIANSPKLEWVAADPPVPQIEWIIIGGESGPGARPMNPKWVRSIRDQCVEAGVPFFLKQWGEYVHVDQMTDETYRDVDAAHNLAGHGTKMWRVGKKRAGRELDGRIWEEFPDA